MNIYIRNALLIGIRQVLVVLGVWMTQRGLTLSEDQQTALANIVVGVLMAAGAFIWSNLAKRKDQKLPDPAKAPTNDSRLPLYFVPLLLLPILAVGCAAEDAARIERAAKRIEAATTQPAVQLITQTVPVTGPIVGGVAAIAGAVGLVAGYFARRKQ